MIVLVSWIGVSAQGLYVGVDGMKTVGAYRNPYWEVGAFASYARPLILRMGFDVEAGLYTQYYHNGTSVGEFIVNPFDNPVNKNRHAVTFGGRIGANLTLKIAGPISIFTGPSANCNFFQKEYIKIGESHYRDDVSVHRAGMQWRVGITADIKFIRLRFSWARDLTGHDADHEKQNSLLLSVAYRL